MAADPINFDPFPINFTDIQEHRGFRVTTTASKSSADAPFWVCGIVVGQVDAEAIDDPDEVFLLNLSNVRLPSGEVTEAAAAATAAAQAADPTAGTITEPEIIADKLQQILDPVVDRFIPTAAGATP